ncbi:MAG: 6-carboxytetrahydropterin synthase QueD [Desulfovibrionaceae bacterium]|nr:6-carboxytetrahydropterin synthase QueD [Desulfovibrionaceae bacterium]
MLQKYWQLTVRSEFSAAHALRHYQGKCENLHGHNFGVEVTVEGQELEPKTEMLVDFKVLKTALKTVLEQLDHHVLNETPPFDVQNPSSENLSRYIWQHMASLLQGLPVRLHSVTVSEKGAQSATYREVQYGAAAFSL